MPLDERELAPDLVAEHLRPRARACSPALGRNLRVERGVRTTPLPASSMRSSSARAMRKLDGDDAARIARVHALGEHFDGQHAVHQAAQRRRAPELVVVAAARIEPDDEARRAHARRERVEIGGQVVAAAFLAALDQDRRSGGAAACPPAAR